MHRDIKNRNEFTDALIRLEGYGFSLGGEHGHSFDVLFRDIWETLVHFHPEYGPEEIDEIEKENTDEL